MEDNFRRVQLSDALEISTEKVPVESLEIEEYISTENLLPEFGGVVTAASLPVSGKATRHRRNDILFSNIRTYFKKLWFADRDGACSNDVIVFRAKDGVCPRFAFYSLMNEEFIEYTVRTSKGTKMPRGDKGAIAKYSMLLPQLETQKTIAAILGALDDKIELNRQMNRTLEEIAQTIFKAWFIEFLGETEFVDSELGPIPRGWEVKRGDEIADIRIGKTPPRKEPQWFSRNNRDIRWMSIKDLGNQETYISKTSEYLTQAAVDRFHVAKIPNSTVVLSFKLTIGRVAITDGEMLSNEAIAHFKIGNSPVVSSEYLYCYLKNFRYDSLGSTSSIATAINSKMVKAIPILIPQSQELSRFQFYIEPFFSEMKTLQHENYTLAELRDTLLPKLISGEIRVPDAKQIVEEKL